MKICPNCGLNSVDSISFWDDSLWVCKTCDYIGPVIEGNEELIREIKRNYNKRLKEEKNEISENDQENQPLVDGVIKICPRCGSDNIEWILPQNWSTWECRTCSYTGTVIEAEEELIREIRENYINELNYEKINKNDQENDFLKEEDLVDEELERKLDELMETDFRLNGYEQTAAELFSGINSNLLEIFKNLNKEILSWNNKIKFKSKNSYLSYSYNAEFLKITFHEDKINLQLSFNENSIFDDYKDITIELEPENENDEIIKLNFSLDRHDDIDYALFLIKQSYKNNSGGFFESFLDKYLPQNKYY